MPDTIDRADRLADLVRRATSDMGRAAQSGFLAAVSATGTLTDLADLIGQGRPDEAIQTAANAGAVRIYDSYSGVYSVAGAKTAAFLEGALDVTIGFDRVNHRAVNYMQNQRLRLISELTDQQRAATREALVDGIRRGLNPNAQARNFRASIGLTQNQQRHVQNYRTYLSRTAEGDATALNRELRDRRFDGSIRRSITTGEPLSPAQIDRMTERYRDRYRAFRTRTIARTEALSAVHSASHEAYLQAIDEGHIDEANLIRTWITANDDRVRLTHLAARGQQRGMRERFSVGGALLLHPGDPSGPRREVVNCRCDVTTRIKNTS